MAFGFNKAFNKFADSGTKLNRAVNQAIGKDVFKDIKKIEEPKQYPPYSSFPEYDVPEPEEWSQIKGEAKQFTLQGNTICISENLDACIQYRNVFKSTAAYYANQFAFKYKNCVQDFDSFANYFQEMYLEGLIPMLKRAYTLLLPFGVFSVDLDDFSSYHMDNYNKAIHSYETMLGIEAKKNQAAERMGNAVGNSIQMRGGGFGFKGAMKGVAKAEAFNFGMGLLGKFTANQAKMSQEEKSKVFAVFKHDVFLKKFTVIITIPFLRWFIHYLKMVYLKV